MGIILGETRTRRYAARLDAKSRAGTPYRQGRAFFSRSEAYPDQHPGRTWFSPRWPSIGAWNRGYWYFDPLCGRLTRTVLAFVHDVEGEGSKGPFGSR